MRDDLPVFVTTNEAAVLAHVAPVTWRSWVLRGKVRPAAQTAEGHLLFALPDVFAAKRRDTPQTLRA